MANKPMNRKDLSLGEKVAVIKELESKTSQRVVAEKYNVSQSAILQIWRAREKITDDHHNNINPSRKRFRESSQKDVEDVLLRWFKQAKTRGMPISGPMLQQKAKDLAQSMGISFDPSLSWVQRWREHQGIVFKRQHGEKQDHDSAAAEHWVSNVWPDIQSKYDACDIYNCDETGLYFRALPEGTMCFKSEKLSGSKKAKQRLTVLLTTNMDGSDKRMPLVIGKSMKPRCFRGVWSMPVKYTANKNAWMTAAIFQDWINELEKMMGKKGRKVCLLLDNCSAHNIEKDHLKHVEVVFLLANTTSSVQPLDQGIIKNFKHHYRRRMLQKILVTIDTEDALAIDVSRAINVLDAVNFMSVAWEDVTSETIRNCFFRGLTPAVSDEPFMGFSLEEIPPALTQEAYAEFIGIDDNVQVSGEQTDKELCSEVRAQASDVEIIDTEINEPPPPPSNKEVLNAFAVIRRQLTSQETDMGKFFVLEREVLDSMSKNVTQKTLNSFWNCK